MSKKEIRTLVKDIEIRKKDDNTRSVGGYVVKWNTRSELIWGEFYEKVAKGAFAKSLEQNTIKALWNHDTNYVLGSNKNNTLRLNEDETGFAFELDLPNNTWGNDAFESIQRGDVNGVSFGFRVRSNGDHWEYIKDEDVYERTLLNVDLIEISPCPFPAYDDGASEVNKRNIEGLPDTKDERLQRQKNEILKRKLLLELEL